jgi:2-polyprenyl-3-methyl-5-hydroxy-6-metoxy-1,4-benzoquinol methylase
LKQIVYKNQGNENILNAIGNQSSYILDVGCGAGDNAKWLKDQGKIVDGITLSEQDKLLAGEYMRDIFIYNLELGLPNIVKNRKYDVVICSHVLEHICWPQALLKDILNVLDDNGRLIVALPNIMHYNTRTQLLFGSFEYTESGIMDRTHFRWYTFGSAKRMLKSNGFKVIKAWVDGHLPAYRITKILPLGIQQRLKKILFAISKGFFGEQLFYIASKNG